LYITSDDTQARLTYVKADVGTAAPPELYLMFGG